MAKRKEIVVTAQWDSLPSKEILFSVYEYMRKNGLWGNSTSTEDDENTDITEQMGGT